MVNIRNLRIALIGCGLLAFGGAASADKSSRIDVPAGDLLVALQTLEKQADVELVYQAEQLKGIRIEGLEGNYSPHEAVALLLKGTSLVVRTDEATGVMMISAAAPMKTSEAGQTLALHLAQVGSEPVQQTNPVPQEDESKEILVTGSRLKAVDTQTAMPVNIYTRQDIERSGQPTITQFLNTLNEVSVQSSEGITQRAGGISSVQLRGLPAGTTLVLINGRRVEGGSIASGSIFPLDLIPQSAVERIEILPVGSSAIYGGDALAGVVNFVLKSSVDGPAINLRYGAADGTDDGGVSFATGGQYERGSFMVLGSYAMKNRLSSRDRELFQDADYRRFGGADVRGRTCSPGTVTSTTTANLPGLTATVAGIPGAGASTIGGFAATAGVPNLCSRATQGNGTALVVGTDTSAVHAVGDFRFGRNWSIFGEFTYTEHKVASRDQGVELNNVLVPATNAYNPFGVAVRVTGRLGLDNGMTSGQLLDVEFIRPLAGLRGELGHGWDIETTVSRGRDRGKPTNINLVVNTAALNAALASSNPVTALNPFTAGRAASDAVLQGIWSDRGNTQEGVRDLFSAFVRGPVFHLPAGSVDVIAGAEAGRDSYNLLSVFNQAVAPLDRNRRTRTIYGEARVPLLAGENSAGVSFQRAVLSLAARKDRFSDFDGKATYQGGLEVRPVHSVLLRAAVATSFKPPLLTQLTGVQSSFSMDGLGATDPRRGNELLVGVTGVFGPNPNLKPETGEAHTLGFVWEPQFLQGLRVSVSDWRLKLSDQITLLDFQDIVNNEAFLPGLIERAPSSGGVPGPITTLQWTYGNIGKVEVAGADMEVAYSRDTSWGKWNASSSATRTRRYDVGLTPLTPIENRVNALNEIAWAPEWKGRIATGLQRGEWSYGLTGRYIGEYNDRAPNVRTLGGYWFLDASVHADLKRLFSRLPTRPQAAAFNFGVVNLTDRQPEYANTSYLYDFTQADVRGRYFSLQLTLGW